MEQRERIDLVSAPQTAGSRGPGSAHVAEVSRLGLGITVDTHHPEEEDGPSGEQKDTSQPCTHYHVTAYREQCSLFTFIQNKEHLKDRLMLILKIIVFFFLHKSSAFLCIKCKGKEYIVPSRIKSLFSPPFLMLKSWYCTKRKVSSTKLVCTRLY